MKVFRHPALGELNVVVTTLDVAATPETRMTVYTPNDDDTRERFDLLRQDSLPHGNTYPCGHSFELP